MAVDPSLNLAWKQASRCNILIIRGFGFPT